jgi:hypothetical protein
MAALACVALLEAQSGGLLVSNPVPLSSRVVYDVSDETQLKADPVVVVDARETVAIAKFCSELANVNGQQKATCEASPSTVFFDLVNAPPFPHMVDVLLRNSFGSSQLASRVSLNPPQPPARTECPWVNPAGVLTPKPIGSDDIRGWNVINPSDPASLRATFEREKQLRAWGLAYRIYGTDDGSKIFKDGKQRIYIYAPCVGPPQ